MSKNVKLTNREIASFFEQISMLITAGIRPEESIRILLQDTDDSAGAAILTDILNNLEQGDRFHDALEKTDVFPDYVNHMIQLGEVSGDLDNITSSLASYYRRQEEIHTNLKNAITYPLIMVAIMIVVMIALITRVLPVFDQVFSQLGSEMTGISRVLLITGQTLNRYAIGILAVIIILTLVGFILSRTKGGSLILWNLFSTFPLVKSFREKIAAARFAGGMALALKSGLDTHSSLTLVSQIVEHKPTQEKIEICRSAIERGEDFPTAMDEAKIFNPLYTRMIGVGFKTGAMDSVMDKISVSYNREVNNRLQTILGVIEPTLVIILSVVVGLILLSVILPLIGIMSSIG